MIIPQHPSLILQRLILVRDINKKEASAFIKKKKDEEEASARLFHRGPNWGLPKKMEGRQQISF